MKNYLILFILLMVSDGIMGQCYIPRLETQSDVDEFVAENPDCTETTSDINIGFSPWDDGVSDINDLSGLSKIKRINGDLYIGKVDSLIDVTGLENVKYVEGRVYINKNPILRNLSALGNIDTIGEDLFVKVNDSLETIADFRTLSHVGGYIEIGFNRNMKSIGSFNQLTRINEHLDLTTMPLVEDLQFENVESINGRFSVNKLGISDFSGIQSLKEVTGQYGYITIQTNPNFISLDGLDNLESIDKSFSIQNSPNLNSISALSNLKSVPDALAIWDTSLEDLDGLQNIVINNELRIVNNDKLKTLNGLKVGTRIEEDLVIEGNEILEDIKPLMDIDTIGGDLKIAWNPSLQNCNPVCELLTSGIIEGTITVFRNLSNCDSPEEVTSNCVISTDESDSSLSNSIFPNPVKNILKVKINGANKGKLTIIGSDGTKHPLRIQKSTDQELIIDTADLNPGIYYIQIEKTSSPIRFIKI